MRIVPTTGAGTLLINHTATGEKARRRRPNAAGIRVNLDAQPVTAITPAHGIVHRANDTQQACQEIAGACQGNATSYPPRHNRLPVIGPPTASIEPSH